MTSYIPFFVVLIASITLIVIRYYYSHHVDMSLSTLNHSEDESATSRHPLKEMGGRKGITDQATLDLATEIARIENNLSRMSKSSPHYKPLSESVTRMKSILMLEGYELVDYLAHPYSPDIKAKAVFIPNENISEEEAVILSVQKPRVNYCGETIQQGHVTVVHSQFLLQHPKWVLSSLYKKIKKMRRHWPSPQHGPTS